MLEKPRVPPINVREAMSNALQGPVFVILCELTAKA